MIGQTFASEPDGTLVASRSQHRGKSEETYSISIQPDPDADREEGNDELIDAQVSVIAAFRSRIDALLATYIPGYAKHRVTVEDKLQGKVAALPYTSALLKQQDYWRPVYVVEQDADGHYVVFAPDVPDTSTGTIVLARREDVLLVPSLSANDLDALLKKRGAGLAEHHLQGQIALS